VGRDRGARDVVRADGLISISIIKPNTKYKIQNTKYKIQIKKIKKIYQRKTQTGSIVYVFLHEYIQVIRIDGFVGHSDLYFFFWVGNRICFSFMPFH